jgi:hypothetical protein
MDGPTALVIARVARSHATAWGLAPNDERDACGDRNERSHIEVSAVPGYVEELRWETRVCQICRTAAHRKAATADSVLRGRNHCGASTGECKHSTIERDRRGIRVVRTAARATSERRYGYGMGERYRGRGGAASSSNDKNDQDY